MSVAALFGCRMLNSFGINTSSVAGYNANQPPANVPYQNSVYEPFLPGGNSILNLAAQYVEGYVDVVGSAVVPLPPRYLQLGIALYPPDCNPPYLSFSAGISGQVPVLNEDLELVWGAVSDAGGAPSTDKYYLVSSTREPTLLNSYLIGSPVANNALVASSPSSFQWSTTLQNFTLTSPTFAGSPAVTNMSYTLTGNPIDSTTVFTSGGENKLQVVVLTVVLSRLTTLFSVPLRFIQASGSNGTLCVISASYNLTPSTSALTGGGDVKIKTKLPDNSYVDVVAFTGSLANFNSSLGGKGVGTAVSWVAPAATVTGGQSLFLTNATGNFGGGSSTSVLTLSVCFVELSQS